MKAWKLIKLSNICFSVTQIHANRHRFDVLTLDVHYGVTNLVHRVCRRALGPANIRGHATCPAQRLAIVCHAINVALRPSHAAINVQEFVVKYVRRNIATNVPINPKLESTSLR